MRKSHHGAAAAVSHLKLLQVAIEYLMGSMDLLLAVDGAEQVKDNMLQK